MIVAGLELNLYISINLSFVKKESFYHTEKLTKYPYILNCPIDKFVRKDKWLLATFFYGWYEIFHTNVKLCYFEIC